MTDTVTESLHSSAAMFNVAAPDSTFPTPEQPTTRQYGEGITGMRQSDAHRFGAVLVNAMDRDVILLPPPHRVAALDCGEWRSIDDPSVNQTILTEAKEVAFFKQSSEADRPRILRGLETIIGSTRQLVDFVEEKYESRVLHLSLAGSAIFKANPGDLDFNVVIEGSHFDYSEVFSDTHPQLFSSRDTVRKKSFITFGSEDMTSPTGIDDSIQTPGYLHQDMIARELLVYPWRNVLLYGHGINMNASPDDVLRRLVTGVAFARRTLNGEVPRYADNDVRISKATARLSEVEMLLKAITSTDTSTTSYSSSTTKAVAQRF